MGLILTKNNFAIRYNYLCKEIFVITVRFLSRKTIGIFHWKVQNPDNYYGSMSRYNSPFFSKPNQLLHHFTLCLFLDFLVQTPSVKIYFYGAGSMSSFALVLNFISSAKVAEWCGINEHLLLKRKLSETPGFGKISIEHACHPKNLLQWPAAKAFVPSEAQVKTAVNNLS